MGIILWKNTMGLLSTLAALVIIVHSEEDPNIVDKQDLRPRVLDTGTPVYDEPWKTLDATSETKQTILSDTWIVNSSEEPPRRRRRMRKRRPQSESTETDPQTDIHLYNEEAPPALSESDSSNIYRTRDRPKRRRKRPEKIRRWQDDEVTERPSRLVVHTRKRPLTDNDEHFSEFSNDHSDAIKSVKTESDLVSIKEITRKKHEKKFEISSENEEIYSDYETSGNNYNYKQESDSSKPKSIVRPHKSNNERVHTQLPTRDDKSLSEFSFETLGFVPKKTNEVIPNKENTQDNKKIINGNVLDESERGKVNGPIDPVTLKELLKKSNGSSLSEILQQHNLSLPDLLHGRENALTLLRKNDLPQHESKDNSLEEQKSLESVTSDSNLKLNRNESEVSKLLELEKGFAVTEALNTYTTMPETIFSVQTTSETNDKELTSQTTTEKSLRENIEVKQNEPRVEMKRRFQPNVRKKLRVKPVINNNNNAFKAQLSRDFITINNRKHLNFTDRHVTKAKEWKDVISLMTNLSNRATTTEKVESKTINTSNIKSNEMTTEMNDTNDNYSTISTIQSENTATTDYAMVTDNEFVTQDTTIFSDTIATTIAEVTEKNKVFKPRTPSMIKQTSKSLKKKPYSRLRGMQRYSTDSVPDENIKDLFGTANTVPVSKFPRTQTQKTTTYHDIDEFTHLEDFMTTTDIVNSDQSTKLSTPIKPISIISTTEEIAKLEIEEIFNDTMTSARLTKILQERNMTLNELVAHRERGSSHVHLADIFHNASREPNPPEPFLSKSLIEPISKETYPLRALLEANLHDPAIKASTLDSTMTPEHTNIQVVMDFGNNVNENSENMGIVSLFRKITESDNNFNKSQSVPVLEGTTPIVTTAAISQERQGRQMDENQDAVSWNELFSLTRANENTTEEITHGLFTENKEIILDRDIDGDGLIVLEDLNNMKDFDINIDSVSNEKFNVYKKTDFIRNYTNNPSGILSTEQSSAKSVTVATACIVGVAMALFLITYAAFKWKHQSKLLRQKDTDHDRIPTPVFENRKGEKNNCSMRSISPMLSSNIYSLNTLDSHTEKDSTEYNVWDRKPFQ